MILTSFDGRPHSCRGGRSGPQAYSSPGRSAIKIGTAGGSRPGSRPRWTRNGAEPAPPPQAANDGVTELLVDRDFWRGDLGVDRPGATGHCIPRSPGATETNVALRRRYG